eukprot:14369956-Alexandrium_andersonii.AAC.1
MSASLVGSEMCIRDSSSAHARRHHAWNARRCRRRDSRTGRTATARGGPVSYTHLTLPTICSV